MWYLIYKNYTTVLYIYFAVLSIIESSFIHKENNYGLKIIAESWELTITINKLLDGNAKWT